MNHNIKCHSGCMGRFNNYINLLRKHNDTIGLNQAMVVAGNWNASNHCGYCEKPLHRIGRLKRRARAWTNYIG
jgi:hypothetical protein